MANNLFSIGYGNRKIESFISLLKSYKISCIIDIRTNPYSRFQPFYNQKKLKSLLEENNISYLFMGNDLGGKPADQKFYVNNEISYPLIWKSESFITGIDALLLAANKHCRICLLCCELKPQECHRKLMVGDYLKSERKIDVKHINEQGVILKEHI